MASTSSSSGSKKSGSTRSRSSKGGSSSKGRASSKGQAGRSKQATSAASRPTATAKRPSSGAKRRSSSAKRPSSARQSSASNRSRSSNRRSSGRSSSGNGSSANPVEAVRGTIASGAQTVANGAQQTGHAIGDAASKAKGPALAGGAALAGVVGGMAIAARGGRRRVMGIPVPGTRRPLVQIKAPRRKHLAKDVVKAAGTMGKAGGHAAELASEVRLAREQLDSRRRRSPIEVVLEGLTARRGRAG
jgi:hypothetical protein